MSHACRLRLNIRLISQANFLHLRSNMSSRQGGKLKPLKVCCCFLKSLHCADRGPKAPKKDKKEEDEEDIAFKKRKQEEAAALKAAKDKGTHSC